MTKYTAEDKLNAVLRYLNGHESYQEIADSLHTDQMTIFNWVKQFEHNGSEGFIKSYTNYSQQFKLDVLNFMNEKGMSSYDVAAIFNIPSPRLVREWRKKFENGGALAFVPGIGEAIILVGGIVLIGVFRVISCNSQLGRSNMLRQLEMTFYAFKITICLIVCQLML